MKTNRKDVIDGPEDLIDSNHVEDQEVKIRITTWIDSDVLQNLKNEAEERKIGYQTILNQKLREVVLGDKDPLHELVGQLEKTVQKLVKKQVG